RGIIAKRELQTGLLADALGGRLRLGKRTERLEESESVCSDIDSALRGALSRLLLRRSRDRPVTNAHGSPGSKHSGMRSLANGHGARHLNASLLVRVVKFGSMPPLLRSLIINSATPLRCFRPNSLHHPEAYRKFAVAVRRLLIIRLRMTTTA